MTPQAAHPTILLGDWSSERTQKITAILHASFKVNAVNNLDSVLPFFQNNHAPLVILPLRGRHSETKAPLEQCEGYQVIQALSGLSSPPEVILFDQNISRHPLNEFCRPFLHQVVAFLDENDPRFTSLLSNKASECFMRLQRREAEQSTLFEDIGLVGRSPVMRNICQFISRAAHLSDVPVLITGESGTGKELIAQAIHRMDKKRGSGPFVAVNCSAISKGLAESEFFGHRRGAFTGAMADRPGYFRAAHRGTIFLDEISELDPELQPKLLRVLQESRVLPVGEERERAVDVRVIAGTNKNLLSQVSRGKFRLDLFHRINVLAIEVPGLKFRVEDIEPLVHFFLRKHRNYYKNIVCQIDARVFSLLKSIEYMGNVRELENLVIKILCQKTFGETIEISDLPPQIIKQAVPAASTEGEEVVETFLLKKMKAGYSLSQVIAQCERILLTKALQETNGNRSEMACLLKTSIRTLFNKMRNHHL